MMSSQPTAQQAEMMTLAALAYTGSTTAPSGESLASQEGRIFTGIQAQLPAAAPDWEATWVRLTPDRANLAFVARRKADAGTAVVALRGTVLSILDIVEDLDVAVTVPFQVGGATKGNVSRGAMEAFTGIAMGTDLAKRLAEGGEPKIIYVTGHSLGGALVTMVAPYLARMFKGAQVLPFTYAAPTAGDSSFAQSFSSQFPAQCLVNEYDVIPRAWAGLDTLAGLYPQTGWEVFYGLLALIALLKASLGPLPDYDQPMQIDALNSDNALHVSETHPTFESWLAEAEFQHLLSTYLQALKTAPLPGGPVVNSVTPAFGPTGGGTSVILTGTGLDTATNVDFGPVSGVGIDINDSKRITVKSPPGIGTVEVTVTTILGTSVGVPFRYDPT
jgi:hypothetical protein